MKTAVDFRSADRHTILSIIVDGNIINYGTLRSIVKELITVNSKPELLDLHEWLAGHHSNHDITVTNECVVATPDSDVTLHATIINEVVYVLNRYDQADGKVYLGYYDEDFSIIKNGYSKDAEVIRIRDMYTVFNSKLNAEYPLPEFPDSLCEYLYKG